MMKHRRLIVATAFLFLLAAPAWGQVSAPTRVDLRDEGTSQGRVGALNCVGAGITCTVSGDTGTMTIASGGSANVLETSINFGTSGGLVFSVTITGAAWVTSSSQVLCLPFGTSADGQTIETYATAGLTTVASNRVAGTGFDLSVYSPYGATGTFRFHCTGA